MSILDSNGNELGRDLVLKTKEDLWYDKLFVRHFVSKVRKLDPDITAMMYSSSFILVFMWRRIIIYKLTLNKLNVEDISIDLHLKRIAKTLSTLKLQMISQSDMIKIKKEASRLNPKLGKQL
jgi:hypothetical protein